MPTPGEALSKSVYLIVVATRESEQLSDELLEPARAPGEANRPSGEQVSLGNHPSALVAFGLIRHHIDMLLAETLDKA